MTDKYPTTPKTTITRLAKRGYYDKKTIYAILDEALFCTIAYAIDNQPFQIPTGFCRVGNTLYIHGSVGSRYMRILSEQKLPVSVSVSLLDGIVLARSAFAHSVNYRSVIIFSHAKRVDKQEKVSEILKIFTEKMCEGRWKDVRKPTLGEWKATMVLALPIEEVSAKVRSGPPIDNDNDHKLEVWAGVLPLTMHKKTPIADPQLKKGVPLPHYLA